MARTSYVIAVGSNRRGRHGGPRAEVAAALALLGGRASAIVESAPVGPSLRRYANAVVLVESDAAPDALLARLKAIEREFGRRRGRRWGARVIDLDIILWSGGAWASPGLVVPHIAFRAREFVLGPMAAIVPGWRDPVSGLTVRQLRFQLTARARAPSRGA
ncbi:2-amino-4-hydroxy-6-hydroxymethyldihydropteridine diphosphokinase [Sphingomonas donggukensis]|uniref:2-amino-4-hydroxy-6-hydroxymethyldihydropteridine pyrophosphokinase n=1 Tax=Sphingomonas donggukensis TaxID=2949093 RepID=A0ABY4TQS3_9SPHN|nr:2-amino-4-hydroxy-6-hydroxymethyldihydropteridine diphosphokinase [Sphingomonas donggukensis]URW74723.1 2-amino-4-hydroxy-6-hydroxymethyldihydropteridine diphosphokinase [Sphingomonas donggukensis]